MTNKVKRNKPTDLQHAIEMGAYVMPKRKKVEGWVYIGNGNTYIQFSPIKKELIYLANYWGMPAKKTVKKATLEYEEDE